MSVSSEIYKIIAETTIALDNEMPFPKYFETLETLCKAYKIALEAEADLDEIEIKMVRGEENIEKFYVEIYAKTYGVSVEEAWEGLEFPRWILFHDIVPKKLIQNLANRHASYDKSQFELVRRMMMTRKENDNE